MAVQTIVGVVVETEAEEEETVAVAIETELDTYLVAPDDVAEELLDLMGHWIEATGDIVEREDHPPVIEIDTYTEIYEEEEEEEEDEDLPGLDAPAEE